MDLRPHIDKFARRFAEVEAALSDPKVFDNNQRAQELSKEYARLKELVAAGQALSAMSLVVAVQCSRSAIAEFDKLQGLATMIDAITGDAPAEVAVIQFGTGEELMTGFTRDARARDAALNKLRPCDYDGGDNIFDAVGGC